MQLQSLYAVAVRIMEAKSVSPASAWGLALQRELKLCGEGVCEEARKLVCRMLAMNFSTSSVERLNLV